jgi:hypothetical protein
MRQYLQECSHILSQFLCHNIETSVNFDVNNESIRVRIAYEMCKSSIYCF